LTHDLAALSFQNPSCPVVCNVDAALVTSGEAAREALIRQVTGTVRWEPSVRLLINQGVSLFIEVGPGKVLWGLMRQIDRSKTCLTVADEASLQKALEQIAAMAA
jgi:[acyl-carrier-protein] S-malonyltransferase